MRLRNAASGFTLAELMVVLAIVGILAAAALPTLARPRREARIAATELAAHCLEGALAQFDPASPHADRRLPLAVTSDADLFRAGDQLGCSVGPTAAQPARKPQAILQNCRILIVDGGGEPAILSCLEASQTSIPADAQVDYEIRLSVPGVSGVTVTFGSNRGLATTAVSPS